VKTQPKIVIRVGVAVGAQEGRIRGREIFPEEKKNFSPRGSSMLKIKDSGMLPSFKKFSRMQLASVERKEEQQGGNSSGFKPHVYRESPAREKNSDEKTEQKEFKRRYSRRKIIPTKKYQTRPGEGNTLKAE